ncbi:MAG: hypothetical protein IPP15_08265 [Saprospiraceae bacterium]|uniref:Uncharacterized protein n=1 Tax=Candidatus Opimibacter skivensis TaxID=2982028 RepID=A0A9D7XNP2_9BACT|nr:hypothetical protein [Candidatus Opimibacter skivensis]
MNTNSKIWVRIALINLCIVATLGTIMRYKIGFAFPYLDQKYLQEAHSHFAFTGWITHSLYFLIVILFRNNLPAIREKIYQRLILINLLCAYGMLISFLCQGYGPVSIFISVLSILTGYVFAFFGMKDASRLPSDHPAKNWIKAALFFSILSTFGTFSLAYMATNTTFNETAYLGSIYFFLHFQYNGWFLFGCMALFMDRIKHIISAPDQVRYSFWLFFLAGIPAYFLSTLWANLPLWLYVFVVIAAFLQVIGWALIIRMLRPVFDQLKLLFHKPALVFMLIIALAFTFKLFLQLGSTVPAISKLAFGFRPIVIAYLHLVLLLIVSMFLLTFMYSTALFYQTKKTRVALSMFASGVILNEIVLATQGIGAFSYTIIPFANEILFAIALILLTSSILLAASQLKAG